LTFITKKIEPTRDVISFFAFVSFFPQLVAGPIERATNLLPQFYKPRTFDYANAVDGMRQILWGLFKKIVVADRCAVIVNQTFANYQNLPGNELMIAAILFAFQIYGDFSGYSDIAIGTSRLFGINLKRNFAFPYFSRDIAEFWRRWHISLTTWFRDYIYIPLGGSRTGKGNTIRNTMIVFLVSGFWHGANWTFIVWGAYHALLFMPLLLLNKNRKNTDIVAQDTCFPSFRELLSMIVTFILLVIGWIIFRADNISQAIDYMVNMCDIQTFAISSHAMRSILPVLILIMVEWFGRKNMFALEKLPFTKPFWRWLIYLLLIAMIVGWAAETSNEFIYFQF
jgi:D-alanyl-lipoteichoic acid acyltransferase DltB (MBOAT superfamily)